MEILTPMDIQIPSPYSPTSEELFDWENFLRDAFTKVNNMKYVGKTYIVNANQFASLNDAITAAQQYNGVVYLPKGSYVWNGATYTQDVVIISDGGASITLNGTIVMSGTASLWIENVSITNNHTGNAFGVSGRTTRTGRFVLKDVIITYPNAQTGWGFQCSYFDVVVFENVSVTVNQSFSGRIGQIDNTNIFYAAKCKFVSPVLKAPYGLYVFADTTYMDKTQFYNCQNYFYPQTDDSPAQAFFFDCYFEINWSDTSANATAVWLNITTANSMSAIFVRCSFKNVSSERANVGWGIVVDSAKSCIVNSCIFENVTGVRSTINVQYNTFVPSLSVVNSIFKNCFRRAIEILYGGHVYIANNLIYTDATWDGFANYTLDGLGEAIRLYSFRAPADNTITNSMDNPVLWVVKGNTIKRYLKAGIRIMVDTGAPATRRIYNKMIIQDNIIENIHYYPLLSTSRTSYESTYGATAWERGSGFVAYNSAVANASWVTYSLKNNTISGCHMGFYHNNYQIANNSVIDGSVLIDGLTVTRLADTQEQFLKYSIFISFSSANAYTTPFVFKDYFGNTAIYANNGITNLFFVGGFMKATAKPNGGVQFPDVASSVRLVFVGTKAIIDGNTGSNLWTDTFEKYEGNILAVPYLLDSNKKFAGGFVGGVAVGRIPTASPLKLYKADGSAPTILTINTLPYEVYQVTAAVPVYGKHLHSRQRVVGGGTYQVNTLDVAVALNGVPLNEQVTVNVSVGNIFSSTLNNVGSVTVTGNGAVATQTASMFLSDSVLGTAGDVIKFSIASNPSAGSVHIVHAELYYAERGAIS